MSDSSGSPSPSDFSGLRVAVTGATGALGSAVVERLLAAGAICHLSALSAEEAERFAFKDHPRVHLRQPVQLGEELEVEAFYTAIGPLWASIHCAGGYAMSELAETSFEAWRAQQASNLDSCFLCCREAAKAIRLGAETSPGRRGGRIVNVSARPALEPRQGAGMAAYTVAKAGVAALTQALGEELAGEGIWVNAVVPSIMDTPANRRSMPGADHGRWPKVGEVADTIVFLASPANRATRGGLVPVYGGF